jgi:hypothetical protein
MTKITFTELADLCHELNGLTNRQYRPGHQLVKLFNSLSEFSTTGEFYKNDDQVLRLFNRFNPDYKQSHPHIVSNLAKFIVMPENEKKEALQNFAKQLDEHEQWEWESRRKAKTRRKAHHHGRSPSQPSKYLESPPYNPVAGMSSLSRPTSSATLSSMSSTNTLSSMSSEEPMEDRNMAYRYKDFDNSWEDRWQNMNEHERYRSEMSYMREHQGRPHYPQFPREKEYRTPAEYRTPPEYRTPVEHESERAAHGKSFKATDRHISAQLYHPTDYEYESVLALDRWDWDDSQYSDLVNRLYDDEDRHLSPYVNFY